MEPRTWPSADEAASVAAVVRQLMTWAAGVGWDDIPPPVRRRAALVLVDDLSAMAAGRDDPELKRLHECMLRAAGTPEASVFTGRGLRADRYNAASANAAAGTWCELDEGYRGTFCHAGIYILPALLAEAEAIDAPVRDVLRSLAVAYEVTTRIARGFPGTTRDLHPHGCFAVIGAAMGLALLRGSEAPELHAVLNTACSFVNPTPFDHAFAGAMVRNVWAAVGTANGMRAAHWARLGITGLDTAPATVYRGALGAGFAPAAMTEALGRDWAILFNFQRRHACCQFGHSTIEATQALRRDMPRGRTVDDLEQIIVAIHPLGLHLDRVAPETTLGARFSMPHITAAATVLGHAEVSAYSRERIADPRIASLRERVVLVPYEPMPAPPADRPARVTWRFADGTERTAECLNARGEPGRPYTEAEILDKVASIAGPVYPGLPERARALVELDAGAVTSGWPSIVAALGDG